MPNLDETMQMIEKNIFRPLPSVNKNKLNFAETGIDQEEEMDPAWPHLQGIYEFFLQLVINESVEVKQFKSYVTQQFVQEFLDLFDSEESVERDYLKNILHKLYAKVSGSRRVETAANRLDPRGFAAWHPDHTGSNSYVFVL